jgi:hypothetical protein
MSGDVMQEYFFNYQSTYNVFRTLSKNVSSNAEADLRIEED